MPRRITTFKSRNLLGETRSQEKERLNRAVRKEVSKKGLSGIRSALDKSSLAGATKSQLAKRKKILKDAGLTGQKPRSIRERRRFL